MKKIVINPILKKELTLGSRTVKFPIAVMCYAAFMAVVSLIILAAVSYGSRYYYGSGFYYTVHNVDYSQLTESFLWLAIIQMCMICVIIPILTASSIAGERERQTLDIMLTAPISPYSIAMGKLMAALSNVFLFVVSSIPALALCFIYGGIRWSYLLIFLVQILALGFFAGAVGVFCSSVFKKTIASVIMTMILELAFYLGPFIMIGGVYLAKYSYYTAIYGYSYASTFSMEGWALLLLCSPVLGFLDAMISACTTNSVITDLVEDLLYANTTPNPVSDFLYSHWAWFSFAATIALGFFFVYLAGHSIDSIRRKGRRMKKRSMKNR